MHIKVTLHELTAGSLKGVLWFHSHHVVWYLCHFSWTKVGFHTYNPYLKHQLFWTDCLIASWLGRCLKCTFRGGSVPLSVFTAMTVYIFPVTRKKKQTCRTGTKQPHLMTAPLPTPRPSKLASLRLMRPPQFLEGAFESAPSEKCPHT